MKKQTVKQFFEFLEKKEKTESPFLFRLVFSPESFGKKNFIYDGNLELDSVSIETLPENLTVKGVLDLENSLIRHLPKKLVVEESLVLSNAVAVRELPDNLVVGRDLWLDFTYIEDIPKNLQVGGTIFVGNSNILAKYGSIEAIKEAILKKGGHIGEAIMDLFNREDGNF